MGGYGSGRWQTYTPKQSVEAGLTLKLSKIIHLAGGMNTIHQAEAVGIKLTWFRRDTVIGSIHATITPNRLLLRYTQAGIVNTQSIRLTQTDCYFGGSRFWIACPTCNRRALCLYHVGNGFACRVCQKLTYLSSQSAHEYERANTRAIIRRLNALSKLETLHRKLSKARHGSNRWHNLNQQINAIERG